MYLSPYLMMSQVDEQWERLRFAVFGVIFRFHSSRSINRIRLQSYRKYTASLFGFSLHLRLIASIGVQLSHCVCSRKVRLGTKTCLVIYYRQWEIGDVERHPVGTPSNCSTSSQELELERVCWRVQPVKPDAQTSN